MELPIDIRVSSSAVEQGLLREAVESYVGEVHADLGLPIRAQCSWHDDGPELSPNQYELSIGGKRCQIAARWHKHTRGEAAANDTALALCWNIYHNRRLLVSSAALEKLRSVTAVSDTVPDDLYAQYVIALIERGTRLDKPPEVPLRSINELRRAILDTSPPKVTVIWAAPDASSQWSVLRELEDGLGALHADVGVPLVGAELEFRRSHQECLQIRFNDLRSPPLPTGISATEDVNPLHWKGPIPQNLRAFLQRNAGHFVTLQSTLTSLSSLRERRPVLVKAANLRFDVLLVAGILRELAEEGIPISDLHRILEALVGVNGATDVDFSKYIVLVPNTLIPCPTDALGAPPDVAGYVQIVRYQLKTLIAERFLTNVFELRDDETYPAYVRRTRMTVILVDRNVESVLTDTTELSDKQIAGFDEAAIRAMSDLPDATFPIVLTTMKARKRLWRLTRNLIPDAIVMSYQDVWPICDITPVARIEWRLDT